ncbi:MAG: SDR family NAD(P)-dependent oxidoreductase [Pseudobdellovibrionaceae bacterium]|jgi:short-subunit dehydrogenase|nr:SDR family NAD(P)-dependent oxidoreductase [Pseudobdellovibrionaceae bacterium]
MNILITGASSGIGEALAEHYAQENANLFISGRNSDRLVEVEARCKKLGGTCQSHTLDVKDRDAMADWVAECETTHPLDLVIANAGISGGTSFVNDGTPLNLNVDREIFETNISGVMNTIHPAIEVMKTRKRGHIAIVSSIASYTALPGAASYSASKAAVRYYGEALAIKLKPLGISVSIICPGFIESRITAANKFPMPFLMSAPKAAKIIANGLSKKKTKIEFPLPMVAAIKCINLIPYSLKRDIFSHLPEKHSH